MHPIAPREPTLVIRVATRQRFRTIPALSVLFAALACDTGAPTAASLPADSGLESPLNPASTGVTSDVAPSFITAAVTNQPSGFSPIAEWAATAMIPISTCAASNYGITSGRWCRWYSSTGTGLATDAAGPKTPSGVLQFRLPRGMTPGGSYGMVSMWSTTQGQEYSKIYESGWIKIPSSNFEMHAPSAGLKMLGLWGVGKKGYSNNQLVGWTAGVGTNPVSAFLFELRVHQDIKTQTLRPNVGNQLFTAGKWHQYEMLMEINSLGQANGKFQMWWDGIKTHNYSNVVYRTYTYPAKFFGRKIDPVWGGNGGSNKSREDRVWFDHVYISGVK